LSAYEFIIGLLILEENDLTENLDSGLKAYRHLHYFCNGSHLYTSVDLTLSVGTAYPQRALTDCWKNGIAIVILEIGFNLERLLEYIDGA